MPKHFSSQRMHRTGKLHYLELLREAEALEHDEDLSSQLEASLDILYGIFMCSKCHTQRVEVKGQVCFACRRGRAA